MTNELDLPDVGVAYNRPTAGFTPQDLTELGAHLSAVGMSTLEARSLMSKVQQAAASAATVVTSEVLDQVTKLNQAKLNELAGRVQMLPRFMGYVSLESVLLLIATTGSTSPRT